jgi:glycosyltransferase involved in cell wall biosynthesis
LKKLRFAYLSADDPRNKRVWSGTHHNIYKALNSLGEVTILGPFLPNSRLFLTRILNQLSLKLRGKRIGYRHSTFISKGYADYFNKKLKEGDFDYIIAPAASCEIAFVETKTPIIYITDGTFASCLNYHKALSHLTKRSITEGNLVEKKAVDKSKTIIVSSEWAANSLRKDYQCPENKIHIIPYGANFELLPNRNEINFSIPEKVKLLFVAVYWEDKGGEIVWNAFQILEKKGYDVELTILGCEVPEHVKSERVKKIPFIDKNDAEGQKKLHSIFLQHQLLILPTRFDCSPIVINEASAFGIPCLVAKTGGIEGHLQNGKNGFVIDYNDKGEGYANIIERLLNDKNKFSELRKSTRSLYEEELNWEHWKTELTKILGI